jgi:hypothetical protein
MAENSTGAGQQNIGYGEGNNSVSPRWLLWIGLFTLLLLAVVVCLGYWLFSVRADRAKFIVDGSLNVFILAAILLQVYVYFRQRDEMQRQREAMDESLKRTDKVIETMTTEAGIMAAQAEIMRQSFLQTSQLVEQNERANEATARSIETAEKTTIYAQRAYITVKSISMTKFIVGEPVEVTIIFVNSGNTPAYKVNTYSRGGPREEPFRFSVAEIKHEGSQHGTHSKGILAPLGDTTTQVFSSGFPLTDDGLKLTKTKPYHAWGVVFYQDIFKRDRWTQFCYVWRPDEGGFHICPECNETDDQEDPN